MKLLTNENIPFASVLRLRALGYDVAAIGESHKSISDEAVISLANDEARTIITFDRDYGTLIFQQGLKSVKGVIYLRLEQYEPEDPADLVHQLITQMNLDPLGCLTVFDGTFMRQRRYA